MAFTLEAALVVPVSIGILAFAISLGLPSYKKVHHTAVLGAAASVCSTENRHLYKMFEVKIGNESSISLETSPSMLIDSFLLAADLSKYFNLNFTGEPE